MKPMKLKPCPFCGSKAEFGYSSLGPVNESPVLEFHCVDCKNDECSATISAKTKAKAVKAWNRRAK